MQCRSESVGTKGYHDHACSSKRAPWHACSGSRHGGSSQARTWGDVPGAPPARSLGQLGSHTGKVLALQEGGGKPGAGIVEWTGGRHTNWQPCSTASKLRAHPQMGTSRASHRRMQAAARPSAAVGPVAGPPRFDKERCLGLHLQTQTRNKGVCPHLELRVVQLQLGRLAGAVGACQRAGAVC